MFRGVGKGGGQLPGLHFLSMNFLILFLATSSYSYMKIQVLLDHISTLNWRLTIDHRWEVFSFDIGT